MLSSIFRSGAARRTTRLARQFSDVKADIKLVKQLRERTGAPMMDCKKALSATANDPEGAIDWLRKNGMAAAAKKAGRETTEGLVCVSVAPCGTEAAVVEVNSETDFVARNDVFQALVERVALAALECRAIQPTALSGDNADCHVGVAALMAAPCGEHSVEDELRLGISTVQENLVISRVCRVAAPAGGLLTSYVHNAVRDGLGQSVSLVVLGAEAPLQAADAEAQTAAVAAGRRVAMHVAAARPRFLGKEDIPSGVRAKEEGILAEEARGSGKKEEMIGRIVQGRMNKWYSESCLQQQQWLLSDTKLAVAKIVDEAGTEAGVSGLQVASFVRLQCGESTAAN